MAPGVASHLDCKPVGEGSVSFLLPPRQMDTQTVLLKTSGINGTYIISQESKVGTYLDTGKNW